MRWWGSRSSLDPRRQCAAAAGALDVDVIAPELAHDSAFEAFVCGGVDAGQGPIHDAVIGGTKREVGPVRGCAITLCQETCDQLSAFDFCAGYVPVRIEIDCDPNVGFEGARVAFDF